MTEKIRLEIEDGASPGLDSIDKKIEELGRDADKAEKEVNQLTKSTDQLAGKGKDVKSKLSLPFTELNQGLQLLKQGAQLAARAFEALAADGNPAALELKDAFTGVQNALLDIANDPEIQSLGSSLASGIKEHLIPAVKGIPDAWRSAQDSIANFTAHAGEAMGVFEKGTVQALKEIQIEEQNALEIAKEAAKVAQERAMVEEKLAGILKRLGDQQELVAMARLTDERLINDLIEEETEQLRELAKEGRATAEQREASLKKIELLQRRLIELEKEEFDATIKDQEEASRRRFEAQQKANETAEKFWEQQKQRLDAEAQAVADTEEAKRQEQEKTRQAQRDALLKAAGPDIARARAQIDPRQLREQVASYRQDFVAFQGGTAKEIRDARIGAFRDFNRGMVGGEEIGRAQNTLLEQQVGNAKKRGQIDSQNAQLLRQVITAEQNSAAQQEVFGQTLAQMQSAMSMVNKTQRNTRAGYQAAGGGR